MAPHPLFRDYLPEYLPEEPAVKWNKLNYAEPSVLRGIVVAAVALAAALGFSTTADINGAAEKLIPVAAVLIPLAQAGWTRAAVWSKKSVDAVRGPGPQTPGVADHAA